MMKKEKSFKKICSMGKKTAKRSLVILAAVHAAFFFPYCLSMFLAFTCCLSVYFHAALLHVRAAYPWTWTWTMQHSKKCISNMQH
jgi:hypothetical protein